VQELDKDLMKRHDEIEALFEDLAARLDALSNAQSGGQTRQRWREGSRRS
jgi:U3 small nucleolar ribonucleoprotein component